MPSCYGDHWLPRTLIHICTPNLAAQLGNLVIWVSDLNLHEESLGTTEESITLYHSLVEKNPTSYTPYLAGQLGNLGISLSNLNRHKELLGATEESITLYRSL